jgi:hypothetical protein
MSGLKKRGFVKQYVEICFLEEVKYMFRVRKDDSNFVWKLLKGNFSFVIFILFDLKLRCLDWRKEDL